MARGISRKRLQLGLVYAVEFLSRRTVPPEPRPIQFGSPRAGLAAPPAVPAEFRLVAGSFPFPAPDYAIVASAKGRTAGAPAPRSKPAATVIVQRESTRSSTSSTGPAARSSHARWPADSRNRPNTCRSR